MIEQMPLGLGPDKSLSFDNFYTAKPNRLLLNQLQLQAVGEGEQWVFMHGRKESGRSHLLQASCQLATISHRQSLYLPLAELLVYPPQELLEGTEQLDLVCLDDVDRIMGDAAWEEALFHAYNRARDSGCCFLMSSSSPAAALPCNLKDLQSRLNGFSIYHLHGLEDDERKLALQHRARVLGMNLDDETADYLYNRSARNLTALFDVLDVLDRQSIQQQRSLTKPFIRQVMGWK